MRKDTSPALPHFRWTGLDVGGLLPDGWRAEVSGLAARSSDTRRYPVTPFLTRESPFFEGGVHRGRVRADAVERDLPWLAESYRGVFRDFAEEVAGEPVRTSHDPRYSVVLNILSAPDMRFECHVDTNPLTGLLFCTDNPQGTGGELTVAHDTAARGPAEIDRNCAVLHPRAGHLVFFDGRRNPHYARALTAPGLRVTAIMNYYTASVPEESTRPRGLNTHLFGQE
ncbi:2-oxoglutarate-Fe(II)-dependent oxygenase superfamily protein [Actinocorallia herbida]|uniref:2-oxoglutarate-Fe(II)-dependent oxygenase superfamily protein n=1 Tax=Actinocorallia herbida TaxID=58109 RepID=A0A3N1CMX1_9ACTN|nr:2OG-Fe(II) oxygenase [Actinocorallia herbida]ROO82676.1 2-oxoglutarate-Fe(II)-dependent oxygenase superfamily protein [Actinocorallia herbida]